MLPIKFAHRASAQIKEAASWWSENPQDTGVEVLVDGDGPFTARELAQVVDVILKDGQD